MVSRIRIHFDKGEYRLVTRLVGGLLATDASPPQDKAAAGIMGARAALHLREPFMAQRFAERALGYAQECGDEESEGRALFLMGSCLIYIGDNASARTFVQQFMSGLDDKWTCLQGELSAKAYTNLGQTYRNQRLHGNALQAFAQAVTRFERGNDVFGCVYALQQAAWVLVELEDYAAAEEHLERAASYGELPAELSCYQIEAEAWLHLKRGEHGLAFEKAQELIDPNRQGVLPGQRALSYYVLAEVSLKVVHVKEARAFALLAREAALETGLARVLNLVAELLRTIDGVSTEGG